MKKILIYFCAIILASSCLKEGSGLKYGVLSLSMTSELEADVEVKSGTSVDCSSYKVSISGQWHSDEFLYSSYTEGYSIPYGKYTIWAENCTAVVAEEGLGRARYYGKTTDVIINTPDPVSVTVLCKMVNSKVSVSFDESFLEDFESVVASAFIDNRKVNFTPENSDSRVAYFNVSQDGATVLKYTVTGTIDGKQLSYSGSMSLPPAKHAKIKFKSNHNGIIGPDTSVEGTMGTVEIPGVIDPESGDDITGGVIEIPKVYVDYQMNEAVVVDCVIDVIG